MRPIPTLLSVLALLSAALTPVQAQEGRLELFLNHAKIVKLAEPASTVVIGNDQVADATIKDATTLVLTGRSFGTTNLVILDENGEPIVDERLVVRKDEADTVRVFVSTENEGIRLSEFNCAPTCALGVVGDGTGRTQPNGNLN